MRGLYRPIVTVIAVVLVSLVGTRSVRAYEIWVGHFDGDVKTGCSREVCAKVSRGGATFYKTDITKTFAYFKGGEVAWTQFVTIWETPSGAISSFSWSCTTKDGRSILEGKVEGAQVRLFSKGPKTEPKEYEENWDASVVGPRAVRQLK
jgi:hypothetical protein